ncbi:glycosyltransferase [Chitinophagaceae bacterium MMS25-I14]
MQPTITIISPCHNENVAVIRFLDLLEQVLKDQPCNFNVVVVDDYSVDNTLSLLRQYRFKAPNIKLLLIGLRFNIGHQGAIYQGLLYAGKLKSDHFIIMDSDGEDTPAAIPELLANIQYDIVHVVRGKRQESLSFRLSYRIYRIIFKAITGNQMNFGNYCLINRRVLEAAVFNNFSHFAAWLSRMKASKQYITFAREKRLDGRSKMSFKNLIHHAFKSLIEYGEDLLMVFLKFFVVIMLVFAAMLGNVLYQKYISHTAILGWTSTILMNLINMAVICFGFFILGLLLLNISNKRTPGNYLPVYDEIKNSSDDHEATAPQQ